MVTLYIAQSIDGFIAGPNQELDWLPQGGPDCGYNEFIENIDLIVMGKNSYEVIEGFGEWPYAKQENWVFSKSLKEARNAKVKDKSLLYYFQELCDRKVWLLGGGAMIREFFEAGLIHEFRIFTIPIVLGDGVPLWPAKKFKKSPLVLQGVKDWGEGIVETIYKQPPMDA